MWVKVLCALDGWVAGKVGGGPPRAPLREHAGVPLGGREAAQPGVLSLPLLQGPGLRAERRAAVGRRQPRKVMLRGLQQFILP